MLVPFLVEEKKCASQTYNSLGLMTKMSHGFDFLFMVIIDT